MSEKLMRLLDEVKMLRVQMRGAASDLSPGLAKKYQALFDEMDEEMISLLRENKKEILKMYSNMAAEDPK